MQAWHALGPREAILMNLFLGERCRQLHAKLGTAVADWPAHSYVWRTLWKGSFVPVWIRLGRKPVFEIRCWGHRVRSQQSRSLSSELGEGLQYFPWPLKLSKPLSEETYFLWFIWPNYHLQTFGFVASIELQSSCLLERELGVGGAGAMYCCSPGSKCEQTTGSRWKPEWWFHSWNEASSFLAHVFFLHASFLFSFFSFSLFETRPRVVTRPGS